MKINTFILPILPTDEIKMILSRLSYSDVALDNEKTNNILCRSIIQEVFLFEKYWLNT